MVQFLTNILNPIFGPMGVTPADLSAYITQVQGHVWAILAVLLVMIVVLIVAKKAKKGKKHVIRWGAVLACIAAITLIVNMMCYGPRAKRAWCWSRTTACCR